MVTSSHKKIYLFKFYDLINYITTKVIQRENIKLIVYLVNKKAWYHHVKILLNI